MVAQLDSGSITLPSYDHGCRFVAHLGEHKKNYHNGEVPVNPLCVVGQIKAYTEFIIVYNVGSSGSNRRETSTLTQKWSPPLEG